MAFGSKKNKKQKGGFLKKLGVQAEKEASPSDLQEKERHEKIKQAWGYLRRQIDKGVDEYFRSGDTATLREFVEEPALPTLLAELEKMRSAGIYWSQPDRATKTSPRMDVISERLNKNQQPERFVVQERFIDNSIYKTLDGRSERVCEGKERVFQATVDVKGGTSYKLKTIIEVRGATL